MYRSNINNSINFFLVTLVSISALLIFLSRIGLDNNPFIFIKSISLSYLIILFPSVFNNFCNLKYNKVFNVPILSFFIIAIIILSGVIENLIGFEFHLIYFLLGFLLFFFYFFMSIKNLIINKNFFFLLIFSIFFSFFITAVYYDSQYIHPLMTEKIINGSWAHRDTLYHAAIAGIFKTYLYVGTGLDGFVPHYYHTFSHSFFGILSIVMGINTLDFYSIVFPILITPIFLMFFIYSILEVSKFFSKINNFEALQNYSLYLWLSLYIFLALPMNPNLLPEKYQYLQSQSYAVALTFFFLIINIFFYYINNEFFLLQKKIRNFSFYFCPLLLFFLAIFASYSKVSFLYLFTIIIFYIFIRMRLFKIRFFLLLLLFWLIYLAAMYFTILYFFDGRDIYIQNTYSINQAYDYNYSFLDEFFFIYLSILFIFLKLISLKIFTPRLIIKNILNNKIIDLELLIIIILTLYIVPYQYFKGIQLYISAILIISHMNFFWKTFIKR